MRSGSHDNQHADMQLLITQHPPTLGQQAQQHNISHGFKCFLESVARLSHQISIRVNSPSTDTTQVASVMRCDRWNLRIVPGHQNFP